MTLVHTSDLMAQSQDPLLFTSINLKLRKLLDPKQIKEFIKLYVASSSLKLIKFISHIPRRFYIDSLKKAQYRICSKSFL